MSKYQSKSSRKKTPGEIAKQALMTGVSYVVPFIVCIGE